MNSGVYTAISGLRAQVTALDIVSNNLANLNTPGFKETRHFVRVLDQAMGEPQSSALGAAVNTQVVAAQGATVEYDGSLQSTGRDLDIALSGAGFLTVDEVRQAENLNAIPEPESRSSVYEKRGVVAF